MKKIVNKKREYITTSIILLSFAFSSLIASFSNKFIFIFVISFLIGAIFYFAKSKAM